jgi:hypothetical protein
LNSYVQQVLLGKKEYKINLFARKPHRHLGIVLEDSTGASLLHIEFTSETTRNLLAKAIGELANAEVRDLRKESKRKRERKKEREREREREKTRG